MNLNELYDQEQITHIEFPKIGRLSKAKCYVTEKINGTNAAIRIEGGKITAIQSRTQLIEVGKDNYGFAAWVRANEKTLIEDLGEGLHFGEWAGPGVIKGAHYNWKEKKFLLFDTRADATGQRQWLTPNLRVVPLLGITQFHSGSFTSLLEDLRAHGSYASDGFFKAEGIVVFVYDVQQYFKVLLENDHLHKGQQ